MSVKEIEVPIVSVAIDQDIVPVIEGIIGVPECASKEELFVVPDIDTTLDLLVKKELPVPSLMIIYYDRQKRLPEFLDALRGTDSIYAEVPIIVISAYSVMEADELLGRYSIDATFALPIDRDIFCAEVSRLLFE